MSGSGNGQSEAGRFGLVLGGGGMRGLAHVGALRALEEAGMEPEEVIGTSIGALVASAWAAGYSIDEMDDLANSIRRRDIFQIAHADMAFKRMRSPALYRVEPLETLVYGLLGDVTFRELPRRLLVAAVEINSGMQVFFGLPGFDDVKVAEAVFASCALPGFFPPREIHGRHYMDGALIDNLPARFAGSRGRDFVVAVDVGASSVLRADTHEMGFAAIFARGTEIVFQQSNESHLRNWQGPPLLLVQPRVEHIPQFSFGNTFELIAEGSRATRMALELGGEALIGGTPGIHPRRQVLISVNRERCTGCGVCLATAPAGTFTLDAAAKAVGPEGPVEWSPTDGGFVRQCPTWAISARPVPAHPEGEAAPSTNGGSTGTAPDTA